MMGNDQSQTMGNDQNQMQATQQVQLNSKEEQQVELLKMQIRSIFKLFNRYLQYVAGGNTTKEELTRRNDQVVTFLNMFAAATIDLSKDKSNQNVLIAAYGHFIKMKQSLSSADLHICQNWLNHAERALLADAAPHIQISQATIDRAEANGIGKALGPMMNDYLGQQHKTDHVMNEVDQNVMDHRKQNQAVITASRDQYLKRKGQVPATNQINMYAPAGGGQNIKFGDAFYRPGSKYYDQRPNKDDSKEDQDTEMKSNDNNSGVNQSVINKQLMQQWNVDAVVTRAPGKQLMRKYPTGQSIPVGIEYPYPCKLLQSIDGGQAFGVQYAKPNDDLQVKIAASSLEMDPRKVSVFLEKWVNQQQNNNNNSTFQ